METTPSYITTLLAPTAKKAQGRKVWSIDLETVWLPFFTATNTQGDTSIPPAALGCPLRLSYDKSGAVRFSQAGRPLVKVVKELGDSVRLVRDNLTAQLVNHASHVATENADAYAKTIAMARQAGEPVHQYDRNQLDLAIRRLAAVQQATEADAKAKAEAIAKAEADAAKAEADALVKAKAEADAAKAPKAKSKELVHA